MYNSHEVMKSYNGAIGVKTGNTREAGHCLVAAAQRQVNFDRRRTGQPGKQVWQDAKNFSTMASRLAMAPGGRPLTSR
jgi:D-alanyl-D-alanine carboxypeptidase